MLYYNIINSLENFYVFLKQSFEAAGYKTIKFQSEETKRLLIVKHDTSNFTVAFNSLINVANNIYNIEIQVFKKYDETLSIHDQLNSIPKENFKGYVNQRYSPPQICINNTDNCKTYLKIKDNYFIIVYDAKGDNSWRQGVYIGEYNSFSDNMNLIALSSSNGNNYIMEIEGVAVTNYLSNHQTNSAGWLGFKQPSPDQPNSWLLRDNGRWDILYNGTYGSTTDSGSSGNYKQYSTNSNIYPINRSIKKFYNYLDNDKLDLQHIYILSKSNNSNYSPDYSKDNYGYLNDIYLPKFYVDYLESEVTYEIDGVEYIAFKYLNLNASDLNNGNGIFLLKKD